MGFCFLRVDQHREKATVAASVQRQKVHGIGGAGKHALPGPILRVFLIGNLIGVLLAAQEGFDFLNAPGVGGCQHLRHFNNPVSVEHPVQIVVRQLFDVIRKPAVIHGQQADECGLACALPAHQTQHGIEFAARMENPLNRAQQKDFEGFRCVRGFLYAQKFGQCVADALLTIPLQSQQNITDGVVVRLVCHNIQRALDVLFRGDAVVLLKIQPQVVDIRVCYRCIGAAPAQILLNVNPFGQTVAADGTFQKWVILEDQHTVTETLHDGSLAVGLEHQTDFLFCHSRGFAVHIP